MGAIKEGDDEADYRIEYSAMRAYGGLGLMGITALTLGLGLGYSLINRPPNKTRKSNFLPLGYTKKTQSGKRIKSLNR